MKKTGLMILLSLLSFQAEATSYSFQCQFLSSSLKQDSPGEFTWVYVNSEFLAEKPPQVIGTCTRFSRVSRICKSVINSNAQPVACSHENLGKYSVSE